MKISNLIGRLSFGQKTALVLAFALLALVAFAVFKRAQSENGNKTVELCLDFEEAADICARNGYPLESFLERCRAIGVSSLSLSEENIGSLTTSGEALFVSRNDFQQLRLLDLVPESSKLKENCFLTANREQRDQLMAQLQIRYGLPAQAFAAGKYFVVYSTHQPLFGSPVFRNDTFMGPSAARASYIKDRGFKLVLKAQNYGDPSWLLALNTDDLSGLIFEKETPGYPGAGGKAAAKFKDANVKLINMEFQSLYGGGAFFGLLPDKTVRAHSISVVELSRDPNNSQWINRWVRAVSERNIRFAYFHFFANKGIEQNLEYLRELSRVLKKNGFTLALSEPPGFPNKGNRTFRIYLALTATIIFPLVAVLNARKINNPIHAFVTANSVSLLGGLVVAAVLGDVFFMQKISDMPGVKLSLLLPMVLALFIVFPFDVLKKTWNKNLRVKHLVIAGALIAAAAVLLIRTGNNSNFLFAPEQKLRELLEQLLFVRPRTKEFLFGHPMLLAGFVFKKPVLIWFGMIGQVSILNTFMHAHTPVTISLIRTVNGIWMGLLIGYIFVLLIKYLHRHFNLGFKL